MHKEKADMTVESAVTSMTIMSSRSQAGRAIHASGSYLCLQIAWGMWGLEMLLYLDSGQPNSWELQGPYRLIISLESL